MPGVANMPLTGFEHGEVALNLVAELRNWVKPRRLGTIVVAETGFQLASGTVLAADVAYVLAERAPARGPPGRERFWPQAPDLVAEVALPGQTAPELAAKARAWIAAGVRPVWPKYQQVEVWRPDAQGAAQLVATLSSGDALDGLDVLPGLSYRLAELFD
jgi:Uma2 family endonuclease